MILGSASGAGSSLSTSMHHGGGAARDLRDAIDADSIDEFTEAFALSPFTAVALCQCRDDFRNFRFGEAPRYAATDGGAFFADPPAGHHRVLGTTWPVATL